MTDHWSLAISYMLRTLIERRTYTQDDRIGSLEAAPDVYLLPAQSAKSDVIRLRYHGCCEGRNDKLPGKVSEKTDLG